MPTVGKYQDTICDAKTGRPLIGVAVTVYDAGTVNEATRYDETGTTPDTSAIVTDAEGYFAFYAEPGSYDLAISHGDYSRTFDNVLVGPYPPGPQGATGAQGPKGDKGDQGEQGNDGAVGNVTDLMTTSSTSRTITNSGSMTFTVDAGKAFVPGVPVTIASAADPSNNMSGTVTGYSSTTLTVTLTASSGSGTLNDWEIFWAGSSGLTLGTGSTNAAAGNHYKHAKSVTIPDQSVAKSLTHRLKTYGIALAPTAEGWDSLGIRGGAPIQKIGATYYMIYNGWNSYDTLGTQTQRHFHIGLATSPDLRTWTKYGTTPIISDSILPPDVLWIFADDVYLEGGTYYLFCQSRKVDSHVHDIDSMAEYYYTSTDMINWTYGGLVTSNEALGLPYPITNASIVKRDGYYYMKVDYYPEGLSVTGDGFSLNIAQIMLRSSSLTSGYEADWNGSPYHFVYNPKAPENEKSLANSSVMGAKLLTINGHYYLLTQGCSFIYGAEKTVAQTAINTSTNNITLSSHGLTDGQVIKLRSSGTFPTISGGYDEYNAYYVDYVDVDTFGLRGDILNTTDPLDITAAGSGNLTISPVTSIASGYFIGTSITDGPEGPYVLEDPFWVNDGTIWPESNNPIYLDNDQPVPQLYIYGNVSLESDGSENVKLLLFDTAHNINQFFTTPPVSGNFCAFDDNGNVVDSGFDNTDLGGAGIDPLATLVLGTESAASTIAKNLHIVAPAADSGKANILIDWYGGSPVIIQRRANGTEASPTQVTSGQQIFFMGARVYFSDTAAFDTASAGGFKIFTLENVTSTAKGTEAIIDVVVAGTTTQVNGLKVSSTATTSYGTVICPSLKVDHATATDGFFWAATDADGNGQWEHRSGSVVLADNADTTATINAINKCQNANAVRTLTIPNGTSVGDIITIMGYNNSGYRWVIAPTSTNLDDSVHRSIGDGEVITLMWEVNSLWICVGGNVPARSHTIYGTGSAPYTLTSGDHRILYQVDADGTINFPDPSASLVGKEYIIRSFYNRNVTMATSAADAFYLIGNATAQNDPTIAMNVSQKKFICAQTGASTYHWVEML